MAEAGARTGAIRQRWLDVVTPHCGAIQEQRALLISSRARLLRARHERSSSRARCDVEHADRGATPYSSGRRSQRLHTRAVARFLVAALRLLRESRAVERVCYVLDAGVAQRKHSVTSSAPSGRQAAQQPLCGAASRSACSTSRRALDELRSCRARSRRALLLISSARCFWIAPPRGVTTSSHRWRIVPVRAPASAMRSGVSIGVLDVTACS